MRINVSQSSEFIEKQKRAFIVAPEKLLFFVVPGPQIPPPKTELTME